MPPPGPLSPQSKYTAGVVALEDRCAGEIAIVEVRATPRAGMIRIGRRPVIWLPPDADARFLGVVVVLHAQVVIAAAQRRAAVRNHDAWRLPPVNDWKAIHAHAHTIVGCGMEAPTARRDGDGTRPSRREMIDGDAGIGRAEAPVEVDVGIGARQAGLPLRSGLTNHAPRQAAPGAGAGGGAGERVGAGAAVAGDAAGLVGSGVGVGSTGLGDGI